MKKLVSGIIGTQEMFELEERISISRDYEQTEANAMALHRRRRIGQLALTERTLGFRSAVGGLWIPHSQSENMAVTSHPDRYIKQSAELVKEKVFEKYLDEDGEPKSDLSRKTTIAQVAVWAQFASNAQQRQLAVKYDGWREDGKQKYLALSPGLNFEGTVARKHAEENAAVMGSMAAYLADLKSYIGHPDTIRGANKRNWMQDRFVKKRAAHLEWSKQFLSTQPDWEFDRWFTESWYNHRSRAKFWYEVIRTSSQMHDDILAQRRINDYREDMISRGYDPSSL